MRNLIAGGCGVEGTRSHAASRLTRMPACLAKMPPHGTEQTSTKHSSRVAFGMGLAGLLPAGAARANGRPYGSTANSGSCGRSAYSQNNYNGEVASYAAQMRNPNDTVRTTTGQRRKTREDVLRSHQYSLSTPRLSVSR